MNGTRSFKRPLEAPVGWCYCRDFSTRGLSYFSGNSFFHFTKSYFSTCHSSTSSFLSHSLSKYCWANSFTFSLPYSENPSSCLSGTCVGLNMANAERTGMVGNLFFILSFNELTYLARKFFRSSLSQSEKVRSACLSWPFGNRSLWSLLIGTSVCKILSRSSKHFSSVG